MIKTSQSIQSDPAERAADALAGLLQRAEAVLARVEALMLPVAGADVDWSANAWRWVVNKRTGLGQLVAVSKISSMQLCDLHDIDAQKAKLVANTEQFLAGRPANNVLMTGARGCGKSSLVRALLTAYRQQGLRIIEIDKHDLRDIPEIVALLTGRPEKFILFCDDLSFEAGESGYTALKSVLDGSVAAVPDNVLIYATSNRRHLMPEYFSENAATQYVGDEIHPGEAVEEKISLSERFGLWLSFYPFSQAAYLDIVNAWLKHHGLNDEALAEARQHALNWAVQRGSRSGRVAEQFARDWVGQAQGKGAA
ncbi:MAG: ATP-binding protein [Fluviibacter sp.]|jgi:predicted AAA+ superfamily ATPase